MKINLDNLNLTSEQKAKILSSETPEKIRELAAEEGFELTTEQLENISGGSDNGWGQCPKYDSDNPSKYDC